MIAWGEYQPPSRAAQAAIGRVVDWVFWAVVFGVIGILIELPQ